MGGYSGSHGLGSCIDGDGIGGTVDFGVVGHHLGEAKVRRYGGGDRAADQTRGVADHEGGFGGGEVLGSDNEVAFIFAVGGVEDDDEGAAFWMRGDVSGWNITIWVGLLKASTVSSMLSNRGSLTPFMAM